MRSGYCGVCEQLAEILNLLSPFQLVIRVFISPNIRVPRTNVDGMAKFLAAIASHVLKVLAFGAPFSGVIVFILVLLALMLGKLAAGLIFPPLTAAPPHFTSIYSSVGSATPVEVLFFVEFLGTHLAHFDPLVHFSLATLEFNDSLLHLFTLSFQNLLLLVKFHAFIQLLVQVL